MRAALLSDIHGNILALEAVLDDIQARGGVDEYWVLGDIVALGPMPIPVLERLHGLPTVRYVRGNTDRYVVTGERPFPSPEQVKANNHLLPRILEVTNGFSWTQGAITSHGWFPFLAALPLEMRVVLPNGTRFLGVHASPGNDDGQGVDPSLTPAELRTMLANCEADLVCVGHTHWPADLQISDIRVVNLGSVSNPRTPNLKASYVILDANEDRYQLSHHAIAYDHQQVIEQLKEVNHPAEQFISRHFRGEFIPKEWGEPKNIATRLSR